MSAQHPVPEPRREAADDGAAARIPLSQRAAARGPDPAGLDYLDGLNAGQRAAVETLEGPVLVLAGAGTGKTRALTTRLAHLLTTGRCRPNEILAVTFTNKAAREMRERVGHLVGSAVEGMPWLGTFHSVSARLLRRHAELAGLESNFTILDTDDQLRLLKQLIQAEGIDDKRWPPRVLAGLIDHWKNRGWTPSALPDEERAHFNAAGGKLYTQYQERLKILNACDFGDLLLHTLSIFKANDDVLAQYRRWFRYILVDEYQDTNVAQYLWLRLLAQKPDGENNICCVGDDDQSIYGWRGAEVGNILRFEKDFPGAQIIRLEQNYRSTEHILAAASGVISANTDRLGKTLFTEEGGGDKVRLMGVWDGEDEARWIGEEIEALQAGSPSAGGVARRLDDIAILVRASHQMRAFEDRFLTIGIPYKVIGGPRFYERAEIRDALAYLRVVAQPNDGLAFERIVNTPRRGIGDKALQTIQVAAREAGVSLLEGARRVAQTDAIRGKARKALGDLVQDFDRWRGWITGEAGRVLNLAADLAPADHVELAERVLDESGYMAMWKADKSPDAPGRIENLKELVAQIGQFESLEAFLEHISLVMDAARDDAGEMVSIMTLHGAKGLEFPVVFLPGWEDGLFPSQRAMDESGKKGVEEERRLAYVGITRARERLTISFAANRRIYNQNQSALPSRFIDELPEAHVEVLTPPGLYGGAFGAAAATPGGFGDAVPDLMKSSLLEERAQKSSPYASPGWKRMQTAASQPRKRGATPREARGLVIDAEALARFEIGQRVFHQKFGYGAVIEIEGDKLAVDFEKAGPKKVVAAYLTDANEVPF